MVAHVYKPHGFNAQTPGAAPACHPERLWQTSVNAPSTYSALVCAGLSQASVPAVSEEESWEWMNLILEARSEFKSCLVTYSLALKAAKQGNHIIYHLNWNTFESQLHKDNRHELEL